MRNDAIIDRKLVKCNKASSIGYGKWKAQVGDLIVFSEGTHSAIGRMLGRVHYAPACGETPIIRNYLLVVCINDILNHTYERWVNPADVTLVESPRDQQLVVSYFLSDDLVKSPIEEVRRSTDGGWSTIHAYRAWRARLAADQADFDKRHPKGVCICSLCNPPSK